MTDWHDNLLRNIQALSGMTSWHDNLVRALQTVASPAWEDIIYRTLHSLEELERTKEVELSTWWLDLPLQVRVAAVATFVWACVFISLVALSLEDPYNAAIVRDTTGLNPTILATAAAGLASCVYKHFAHPDTHNTEA